jgi:hypothetical protein
MKIVEGANHGADHCKGRACEKGQQCGVRDEKVAVSASRQLIVLRPGDRDGAERRSVARAPQDVRAARRAARIDPLEALRVE